MYTTGQKIICRNTRFYRVAFGIHIPKYQEVLFYSVNDVRRINELIEYLKRCVTTGSMQHSTSVYFYTRRYRDLIYSQILSSINNSVHGPEQAKTCYLRHLKVP